MTKSLFDLTIPMSLSQTVSIYEYSRPMMPDVQPPQTDTVYASRLRDLFEHFDALLLDGFGVLNVGADAIPKADQMLAEARAHNITAMVLTNGASKDSTVSGQKYQAMGLDIDPAYVVSSRDALLWQLAQPDHGVTRFGVIDSFTEMPAGLNVTACSLTPDHPEDWTTCDTIGFFGAVHWNDKWQYALETAVKAGVHIMVANPDVAAPHKDAFSREPGFWVAKAIHDTGLSLPDTPVSWYGKPYPAVYDLALQRLEQITGQSNLDRKRIAMVGDTLHTDILGGQTAGLSTVLITDHGLFRQGGAEDIITKTGIRPDFIVETV